jgi:hypothetical protein
MNLSDQVHPISPLKTRKVLGKPKGRTGRKEAMTFLSGGKRVSEADTNHVGGRLELGNESSINSTDADASWSEPTKARDLSPVA